MSAAYRTDSPPGPRALVSSSTSNKSSASNKKTAPAATEGGSAAVQIRASSSVGDCPTVRMYRLERYLNTRCSRTPSEDCRNGRGFFEGTTTRRLPALAADALEARIGPSSLLPVVLFLFERRLNNVRGAGGVCQSVNRDM